MTEHANGRRAHDRQLPLVSLVIATYNEAKFIGGCLDSLLAQTYPADRMEVLVVDGDSTDGTIDVVTGVAADHPQVRLLANPRRIQVCAYNRAIAAARGDLVFIMSAHATYDAEYVERCVQVSATTGAANVGGAWHTEPGRDSSIARSIAVACSVRFGVGGARFRVGGEAGPVDTVPGGAYRRQVFEELGVMDERLIRGEDNEFNARLREHGMTVYFDPAIRTTYYARSTCRGFWGQCFANGTYHVLTLMVNPRGCSLRHFVPFVFVCSLLLAAAAGFFWPAAWWGGAAILGVYLIANLVASFSAAKRNGWRHLFVLPWLFLGSHVSYGLGTLIGLVRFPFRPRYWRRSR